MKQIFCAAMVVVLGGCSSQHKRQTSSIQPGDKEEAVVDCTNQFLLSQGRIGAMSDINASMESLAIGGRQYIQFTLVPRITKCMVGKGYRYSDAPNWNWDNSEAVTNLSNGSLSNFMSHYDLHVSHP